MDQVNDLNQAMNDLLPKNKDFVVTKTSEYSLDYTVVYRSIRTVGTVESSSISVSHIVQQDFNALSVEKAMGLLKKW